MYSLDLFATTATTAVKILGEECALVEEHLLQTGLQEEDRSIAQFDDTSPTSPGIPGYESPPQLHTKARMTHGMRYMPRHGRGLFRHQSWTEGGGCYARFRHSFPWSLRSSVPSKDTWRSQEERNWADTLFADEITEAEQVTHQSETSLAAHPEHFRFPQKQGCGVRSLSEEGGLPAVSKSYQETLGPSSGPGHERKGVAKLEEAGADGTSAGKSVSKEDRQQCGSAHQSRAADGRKDGGKTSFAVGGIHAGVHSGVGGVNSGVGGVHSGVGGVNSGVGGVHSGVGGVHSGVGGVNSGVSAAETALPSPGHGLSSTGPVTPSHLLDRKSTDRVSPQVVHLRPSSSLPRSFRHVKSHPSSSSRLPYQHNVSMPCVHENQSSESNAEDSGHDGFAPRARSQTLTSNAYPARTVQFRFSFVADKIEESSGSSEDILAESETSGNVCEVTESSTDHEGGRKVADSSGKKVVDSSGKKVLDSSGTQVLDSSTANSPTNTGVLRAESSETPTKVRSSLMTVPTVQSTSMHSLASPMDNLSPTGSQLLTSPSSEYVGDDVIDDAGEEVYDMKEYAERFFNDHEKDCSGTLTKRRKKRQSDLNTHGVSKEEILRYNRTGLMPTSLTRLSTPHLTQMACTIFKDLTRFIRQELKDDVMLSTLQNIVRLALERVELRDEVLCQVVRQTNDNPEPDSLRHAWLVLCLCTASFSPSPNLYKSE
ncbi:hypothetical protein ACOMHN_066880 [Nucella lapillus]